MRGVIPIETSLAVKEEDYSEFGKVLLGTIDKSLNQILGETATKAIYFNLEQIYHLKREDIPNNLEEFQFTLERIFGIGALLIEKAIMKNLYSRLCLKNKNLSLKYKNKEQFNFTHYVLDLKRLKQER